MDADFQRQLQELVKLKKEHPELVDQLLALKVADAQTRRAKEERELVEAQTRKLDKELELEKLRMHGGLEGNVHSRNHSAITSTNSFWSSPPNGASSFVVPTPGEASVMASMTAGGGKPPLPVSPSMAVRSGGSQIYPLKPTDYEGD